MVIVSSSCKETLIMQHSIDSWRESLVFLCVLERVPSVKVNLYLLQGQFRGHFQVKPHKLHFVLDVRLHDSGDQNYWKQHFWRWNFEHTQCLSHGDNGNYMHVHYCPLNSSPVRITEQKHFPPECHDSQSIFLVDNHWNNNPSCSSVHMTVCVLTLFMFSYCSLHTCVCVCVVSIQEQPANAPLCGQQEQDIAFDDSEVVVKTWNFF